jgi:hypothetical protein
MSCNELCIFYRYKRSENSLDFFFLEQMRQFRALIYDLFSSSSFNIFSSCLDAFLFVSFSLFLQIDCSVSFSDD